MPGTRDTKAPNAAVLTTVPMKRSPTSGITGLVMAWICSMAAWAFSPSVAPT